MQRLLTAISILLLIGCKSVEIKNASKQNFNSGRSNAPSGVRYSAIVKTNATIQLHSVSIFNKNERTDFSNYQLYNLSNGNILKPNQDLQKGEYQVTVSTSRDKTKKADGITINYLINGKQKSVTSIIEHKDDLLMK